jgi:MFS family permease
VPIASRIVEDLDGHSSSSSTSALLVTIWELGEAAGPLLNAPLSELFGRAPVMHGCNIAFIVWTIVAALSQSTKVFIAARMLTGVAVAANVLNPAIIGDMFESEKRGNAMSLIMLAPLIGGAIGPAISGAIAQTLGWRQVMYMAAGLAILCEILFLVCFRETYKMAILRRRVKKIQQESGEFEAVKAASKRESALKIWHSITRPFTVLFGSSVLMLLSLFASVAFSYFYIMCISLPQILADEYGFAPAQVGSAFLSMSKSPFFTLQQSMTDRVHRHWFLPRGCRL